MSRKNKNKWQGKVGVTNADGTRSSICKTFDTKREADLWEAKTKTANASGKKADSEITMAEMLEEWFVHESPNWSAGTRLSYRNIIDTRLNPKWGSTKINKIQVKDIEAWYRKLRDTPSGRNGGVLSPGSIIKYHTAARQAFNFAIRWEYLSVNPFSKARPPKSSTKEIIPPAMAEVLLITTKALEMNSQIGTALHLSAVTGARRGEVMGLQWKQIDFETGAMRIKQSVTLGDNHKPEIKAPKTNQGRTNTLGENTLVLLKEHRNWCEKTARLVGARITDESFVFSLIEDFSEPMSPDYYFRQFKKVATECGLPNMRLHDLRHYNASRMFEQGADLITVAGRLGHRDGRTTLAVYAHFMEAPDKRAAAMLDQDFNR
jgi:integrase